MLTFQILDVDNKPIKGAVCLIDTVESIPVQPTSKLAQTLPKYSQDDGMIVIDGLADGMHTFEFHIEGQFPGVRLTFQTPYTQVFPINLFWKS